MKQILLALFLFSASHLLTAQEGGMRVFAGMSSMTNQDIIANPEGFAHSGYHIGADGRLMSGTMSFVVGGKYTVLSRSPVESFKLSGHNGKLSTISARGGLEFSLYNITNIIRIRSKILASIDMVSSESGQSDLPQDYLLNDGWFGMLTGLGVDVGPLTLDFEFEYGIVKGYNQKDGSQFNGYSLALGFFF
ncbi:MAG: hypothetical protein V3V14_04095 [Saprospiraceae bacterium]